MKTCTKCGKTKPLQEFTKNHRGKNGYSTWCKACHVENSERWRKDPKNKGVVRKTAWKARIKAEFGLTEDAYEKMLSWSEGGCAICGERPGIEGRWHQRLAVDHNHATGAVRGLLCVNCNHGLGKFKDSKRLLRVAIAYLEYFEPEDDE